MGCFSTCFRKSNKRKHRRRSIKARPRLGQVLQVDDDVEVLQVKASEEEAIIVKTIDESQPEEILEAPKAKLNISGRKKVTFDLNVKIYEGDDIDETDYEPATGNGDGEESEKKQDVAAAAPAPKDGQCNSDSSSSSVFSYPPNYRYQNCRDSDDEMGSEESDIDDYSTDGDNEEEEEDDEVVESEIKTNGGNANVKEESSESLFSLSLDSRKHKLQSNAGDKEVNSPMPIKKSQLGNHDFLTKEFNLEDSLDHTDNFDSVLNPVENLSQWKAVKARSKLMSKQQQPEAKENMVFKDQEITQPIPELEPNHHLNPSVLIQKEVRHKRQEVVAVDTSLSSWLGGSESTTNTPTGKKTGSVSIGNSPSSAAAVSSPVSFDDRPILGALTMEEIKEFSAKSSPRRSPSPSPDDIPIIGTVGSYWSHTGHQNSYSGYGSHCKRNSNIKNKSREGSRMKSINSTPFAKRLERASQMGTGAQTQY